MTRHRLPILSSVVILLLCSVSSLHADRIVPAVKQGTTPEANAALIDGVIKSDVDDLKSGQPERMKVARQNLGKETDGGPGVAASPQFQTYYATRVAAALTPALKGADARFRVNAGCVLHEVAFRTLRGGGSLQGFDGIVKTLLEDKNPGVVLVGLKTMKFVLADGINRPLGPGNLPKLVTAAVKANGKIGAIVEEGYNALTLDGLNNLKGANNFPGVAAPLVAQIEELLKWRTADYKAVANGNAPPPSPLAERPVTVFLPVAAFNKPNAGPPMQALDDLATELVNQIAAGNNSQELLDMVKALGQAFMSYGEQFQDPALIENAKRIANFTAALAPARMTTLMTQLDTEVKRVAPPAPAVIGKN